MEAKETVMNGRDRWLIAEGNGFLLTKDAEWEAIAEKQAEITWKIAFKMGYNQALKAIKDGLSPSDAGG